jgi:CubicO group peptidase (beta-lactamase class C family)
MSCAVTAARHDLYDPTEYSNEFISRVDRSIPDLIRALGDVDIEVRWRAAIALQKTGSAAVPSLIGALTDKNVYIRQGAARVLGDIGRRTDEVKTGLIKALSDPDANVREHAAEALGKLEAKDGAAIQALVTALADDDPFVVGKAAATLGRIGQEAVAALLGALQDTNEHVREAATIAIGKMRADGRSALLALISALKDGDAYVRWGVANDLGAMGAQAKEAAPALMQLLYDPDQDVRWAANLALRMIDPGTLDNTPDWRSTAAVLDSLAPELMKELHIPGASIALIDNRKLIWSKSYGIARVDQPVPVTDETLFEACSMTKPVFAYIVLKLAEQGLLDLDRPLAEYLRESYIPKQDQRKHITARMVLSHTTGLPNWRKGEDERDGPLPVLFSPGSRFGYSGEGVYWLQRIVEHITGEPLEIYAGRTLLRPLGLKHTSFVWTEDVEAKLAAGHDERGVFLKKTKYTHANAAYSLYTTAAEYAVFLTEIMKTDRSARHSLSQKSIDDMLSPQIKLDIREPVERPGRAQGQAVYWGLGWSINETEEGRFFHHSGSNRSGFRCFSQFNIGRGSGIVIMTNSSNGSDFWTRLINRLGNY